MVNGRGDTVVLSYEEYKNMKARIELLEVFAEAEREHYERSSIANREEQGT